MKLLIILLLSSCTLHKLPKKGVCISFETEDELTKEFKSDIKCEIKVLAKLIRNKTVSLYSESTDILRYMLELKVEYQIFDNSKFVDNGYMTERVSMNIIHSPFESFINEDIEYKNLAKVLSERLYYHALTK